MSASGNNNENSISYVEAEEEDDYHQEEAGGGNAGNGNGRRCAACKYLRRRCAVDCVLAPHFPASLPQRYAAVHRVFGASNVSRLLQSLPEKERGRAAETMAAEAEQRLRDPVYGCTGLISRLQEEIRDTQCRLATTRATLAIAAANHAAIDVTERHKQDDDGQQQAAAAAELVDPADEFLDLDGLS